MHKNVNLAKIPPLAASLAGTLLLGLFLNAYFQAGVYYRSLIPATRLAVFFPPESTISPEIVGEKLMNLDGVTTAEFVPKEKALENALAANPSLKEFFAGENPLSSYFLVKPSQTGPVYAQELKDRIRAIDGIEDVRFDSGAFSVAEKLFVFLRAYRLGGLLIGILVLVALAQKSVAFILKKKRDTAKAAFLLMTGIIVSFLGTAGYYVMGYEIFPSGVLQMPSIYFVYQFIAGAALTLLAAG